MQTWRLWQFFIDKYGSCWREGSKCYVHWHPVNPGIILHKAFGFFPAKSESHPLAITSNVMYLYVRISFCCQLSVTSYKAMEYQMRHLHKHKNAHDAHSYHQHQWNERKDFFHKSCNEIAQHTEWCYTTPSNSDSNLQKVEILLCAILRPTHSYGFLWEWRSKCFAVIVRCVVYR